MKKVSVTDRYTYDGKEMSEREREIYEVGRRKGNWGSAAIIWLAGLWTGCVIGYYYKLNH